MRAKLIKPWSYSPNGHDEVHGQPGDVITGPLASAAIDAKVAEKLADPKPKEK